MLAELVGLGDELVGDELEVEGDGVVAGVVLDQDTLGAKNPGIRVLSSGVGGVEHTLGVAGVFV